MAYGTSSRDYLSRAKKRLLDGTPESLFYAAFELRCGIEGRMQEYLEARADVSKKKKKGWQIAKLGKDIEQVFRTGDKVVECTILEKETGNIIDVFYYTPVTSRLRKMAEKLGDLLHCMKKHRDSNDRWWHEIRQYLEEVYQELEKANIGILLGVPMLHKGTGQLSMNIEILKGEDPNSKKTRLGQTGTTVILQVRYLDKLPPTAIR